MFSRKQVEKYHNIHQGIRQNGKGRHIVSIQCQLDAEGPYHDSLLEDGTIMYIGEGGLEEPQEEVKEKPNKVGNIHRMYGNLALKNASVSREAFHVINKHKNGKYEYLGKWIVTRYEYSPLHGYPAHFRFYLNRVEAPEEYVGTYARKIDEICLQMSQPNNRTETADSLEPPHRNFVSGMRVARDVQLVEELKRVYGHTCMICRQPLHGVSVPISEVHHVKPLGTPHNGPDVKENMLVLCPNHHAQFDAGVLGFDFESRIVDIHGNLICSEPLRYHSIDRGFLEYHNQNIYKGDSHG